MTDLINPMDIYAFGLQGLREGQARGKQNRLAALASQAYGADPEAQRGFVQQAVAVDPQSGFQLGKSLSDDRAAQIQQLSQYVGAFLDLPDDQKSAAYPQLAAQAHRIGIPVTTNYDPRMVPVLQKVAAVGAQTGGNVQSTYIDDRGQRVAIMRDGSTRILGANAPNNQIFDTGNGFYGVNMGNLSASPVMVGGQQQAPQAPSGYVQTPFGGVNIDPNIPPEIRAQIAANPDAFAQGGMTQGAPVVQDGQQLRSAPKPAAPSDIERRIGMARQMGASDDQIKQMVLGSAGGEGVAEIPGDTTKTGDSYLATIDPQMASQVRALAEGRMAFPSGTALKSPHWQAMLGAVSQYDPNFDAVNYNARSKTRAGFTSGKEAQTINALNTVAEHLGTFSDNAMALHNTGFPLFNRLKNFALQESGDPRIARFNTAKKAVADEVAKVWRASGGSENDIQENLRNLNGAQSPEQLNAAIGTLTQLIYGKIAALQDQYSTGMGTTQTPRSLVSPEAQAAFDKTLTRMNGGTAAPSAPAPSNGDYSHLWGGP